MRFNRRRFLSLLLPLALLAGLILFVHPRWHVLQAYCEDVSLAIAGEMQHLLLEGVRPTPADQLLEHLLEKYNQDVATVLSGWQSLTLERCEAKFSSFETESSSFWSHSFVAISDYPESPSVRVELSCETRWGGLIVASLVAGLLGAIMFYRLPVPVGSQRRRWIEQLKLWGYSDEAAIHATVLLDQGQGIKDEQLALLKPYHDSAAGNFSELLTLVTEHSITTLDVEQLAWFFKAYEAHSADESMAIAVSTQGLVIDLARGTARVHGFELPIPKTPLFYYAWYALQRMCGDGWYVNPQSNHPNGPDGLKLAELMVDHDGHARPIKDLENNGLRSKILDQNRSKIKDELQRALGEQLAEPFLFEAHKDDLNGRHSYRISLDPEGIKIEGDAASIKRVLAVSNQSN